MSNTSVQKSITEDNKNLDVATLLENIEKLKRNTAYLRLENKVIERYLKNCDQTFPATSKNATDIKRKPKINITEPIEKRNTLVDNYSARRSQITNDASSLNHPSLEKLSFSQSRASTRTFDSLLPQMHINVAIKITLAEKECQLIQTTQQQFEQTMNKQLTKKSAIVKELKLTNTEIQNTIIDFQTYVLDRGVDKLTLKIPLEQFLKFQNKLLKNGNTLIETLRLKTTTLRQNSSHKKSALAVKAELSGILRPVDFEQLQIEKRTFTKIIDDKNAHFIGMRKVAGNVSQSLTAQRKSLNQSEIQLNELKKKKTKIDEDCKRFAIDGNNVEIEITFCQEKIRKLQNLMETYRAPQAFDYMNEKIKLQAVQREIKAMQRKRNIAEIKLKNAKNQLRKKKQLELAKLQKEKLMEKKFKNMLLE